MALKFSTGMVTIMEWQSFPVSPPFDQPWPAYTANEDAPSNDGISFSKDESTIFDSDWNQPIDH